MFHLRDVMVTKQEFQTTVNRLLAGAKNTLTVFPAGAKALPKKSGVLGMTL